MTRANTVISSINSSLFFDEKTAEGKFTKEFFSIISPEELKQISEIAANYEADMVYIRFYEEFDENYPQRIRNGFPLRKRYTIEKVPSPEIKSNGYLEYYIAVTFK